MRVWPVALGLACSVALMALISGCAVQTGSLAGGPLALKEVWFTHTQTVGGQLYPTSSEPQQIWERTDVFFLGKDAKVIMLVVFNDQRSHNIRGLRRDAQGGEYRFQFNTSPTMGRDRSWSVRSWQWNIYGLRLGKHTVDLTIDDVPAGSYSFEVLPDNTPGEAGSSGG